MMFHLLVKPSSKLTSWISKQIMDVFISTRFNAETRTIRGLIINWFEFLKKSAFLPAPLALTGIEPGILIPVAPFNDDTSAAGLQRQGLQSWFCKKINASGLLTIGSDGKKFYWWDQNYIFSCTPCILTRSFAESWWNQIIYYNRLAWFVLFSR